jgi:hypothetical protein
MRVPGCIHSSRTIPTASPWFNRPGLWADGQALVNSRVQSPSAQSFADRNFFQAQLNGNIGVHYGRVALRTSLTTSAKAPPTAKPSKVAKKTSKPKRKAG